ncbi:MAG: LytR C-terminal domain-containing protein [Polaromonas sp.]
MKRKLNTVASLSVLGTLLGCAPLMPGSHVAGSTAAPFRAQSGGVPVKVAAAPAVTPAMPSHEALYTMGRAAHGDGQLTLAAQRYEQVLEMVPDHVGALNALAVIHAQSDRTEKALQLFERAMEIAPGTAHVHNNAGYALLRAGRLLEAERELKLARQLDPANARTLQNLDLLAQANGKAANAASAGDNAADHGTTANSSGPQLVVVAPNIYALQMPPAQGPVAQRPASADAGHVVQPSVVAEFDQSTNRDLLSEKRVVPTVNSLRGVKVEVSNGVGITNMARRMAARLAPIGVVAARLSNARPYRQMKTEIQYAAGQDRFAQALQVRLSLPAKAVVSSRLESGVQVRLVLGHDLAGKNLATWPDSVDEPSAGSSHSGGWVWG